MKILPQLFLSFVVLELVLVISLLFFFTWVETSLCTFESFASGHCYANWFPVFEEGFYLVALGLIFISPMWLINTYIHANQASYYRYYLYLSYVLLLLLTWWAEWTFIWQTLLIMLALKATQHSVLKKAMRRY